MHCFHPHTIEKDNMQVKKGETGKAHFAQNQTVHLMSKIDQVLLPNHIVFKKRANIKILQNQSTWHRCPTQHTRKRSSSDLTFIQKAFSETTDFRGEPEATNCTRNLMISPTILHTLLIKYLWPKVLHPPPNDIN